MDIFTIFEDFAFSDEDEYSSEEEDSVINAYEHLITLRNGQIPAPISTNRIYVNRQREDAHNLLVSDYFSENPLYNAEVFADRFRMPKSLFLRIVSDLEHNYEYFTLRYDAMGRRSFTALQKCTVALRQMAYGIPPDTVDEYFQMSARTARESLIEFSRAIINFYKRRYMRRPTVSDVQALYEHHEAVHGFPDMMGSIDCTHWEWRNCPIGWRAQYMRGDHKHPTIILEAAASQDMWIWHSFFGVAGTNNDIHVIRQSPVFNNIINETAPVVPFQANEETYKYGYYLVDEIYPQWGVLVKTLTCPHSVERKRFKKAQESARKDVERTFGDVKAKWGIVRNAARAMSPSKIRCIMYACCILHNMILEDSGSAICTFHEDELPDPDVNPPRNLQIIEEIQSRRTHNKLQHDLIEHIAHSHIPRIDG